jgi:hypothetical protein
MLTVVCHVRISGDMALDKNIVASVIERMRTTMAKSRWKVSRERLLHVCLLIEWMLPRGLIITLGVCVCCSKHLTLRQSFDRCEN